jgi:calcineurin-like phosphoesterase family protein
MPTSKKGKKQEKKTARGGKDVKKAKTGKATASSAASSAGSGKSGKGHKMTYRPRPVGNLTSKPHRGFGDPVSAPAPNPQFVVIPSTNKQPANLSYDLSGAVDASVINGINSSGQMVFHAVGDTGDVNGTGITKDLATQMETQYNAAGGNGNPAFLYNLGDVVYYNGVTTDYRDQFYDPYKFYPPAIVAIPGNHDGQTIVNKGDPPDPEPSLKGFFANFCDSKRNPSQSSPYRYTMNQPWPYWVLNTPFATFIGLYSNVGGSLDLSTDNSQPQYNWFVNQLQQADKKKALILTVHHCPFSLDSEHGGYPDILDAIDQASAAAGGRYPDMVLSGHVHNYQRFQRVIGTAPYIYIVAGNGGYASVKTMHQLQLEPKTNAKIPVGKPFQTTMAGVSLMSYNEVLPGFLRITVDKQFIRGEYFINDMTTAAQSTKPFDTFGFDYIHKKLA